MKAPFFTVLIDTYNYGEFIEEAVSSVLAQEFPPEEREILVVDDGSTDDTRQRLQKYKGEILYLRKPNGGHFFVKFRIGCKCMGRIRIPRT